MPSYGSRPQDVVQDARGNALGGVVVKLYTTEALAKAGGNPDIDTVKTDSRGRWDVNVEAGQVWARVPDGTVWAVTGETAGVSAEDVAAGYYSKDEVDNTVTALGAQLDGKASTADVAGKADAATVSALSATVSGKADASTVAALAGTVATKANASDLAAKADSTTVTALATTVSGKADTTFVTTTRRAKGSTITPDDFTGANDRAKLQAAVNYCVNNGYPTIVFDRMLDLTGAAAVSIDKFPSWTNRTVIAFEGSGGGIIKNDAGTVFTSATANTGDISVTGVKFSSVAGAGTVLWDGDKILRISSSECEYRNWDRVFVQTDPTRWTQSLRFHKEHIVGGSGPAFLWRECYDATLDDNLVEDRTAFVWNSDGTMSAVANRQLRITHNVIENLSGVPIKLAYCWGCKIVGNYFELNGAATDPQIDLYTLATSARQRAVDFRGNQLQQTAAQKAAKVGAVLMGTTNPVAPLVSTANVQDSGGIMWQFGPGSSGTVDGRGDYAEAGGLLVYPGQEDRYVTKASAGVTTAGRPKSPVVGVDSYFDTTLGKPIWAKTAGTKATISLIVSAGATASGNITITFLGTPYTVAVTAGDTITQVRDKIVAAATTFFPVWKPRAVNADIAAFDALQRGLVSGALSFSGGSTGVTQSYLNIDVPGTNAVWVDASGATV